MTTADIHTINIKTIINIPLTRQWQLKYCGYNIWI